MVGARFPVSSVQSHLLASAALREPGQEGFPGEKQRKMQTCGCTSQNLVAPSPSQRGEDGGPQGLPFYGLFLFLH